MIPQLTPVVKNYAWGRTGASSVVARVGLAAAAVTKLDPAEHYAELWLGDHPSGEAVVGREKLGDWLDAQKHRRLPFLLKLLANERALSIQCHPDAATAAELYSLDPVTYPSPSHKPEISLALSEQVESLCGFCPWVRCEENFRSLAPALELLGGSQALDELAQLPSEEERLRRLFARIQQSDCRAIATALDALRTLNAPPAAAGPRQALQLALRLAEQFPGDVGCLAPLYMNYVVTAPGECLFLAPNLLHAYLEGQIVECMASSDNVIRGGLTPKPRDVSLLLRVVDYRPETNHVGSLACRHAEIAPAKWSGPVTPLVRLYTPPVTDFALYFIVVDAGCSVEFPLLGTHVAVLQTLTGSANIQLLLKDGGIQDFAGAKQGTALLLAPSAVLSITHCEAAAGDGAQTAAAEFPSLDSILKGDASAAFVAVVATANC